VVEPQAIDGDPPLQLLGLDGREVEFLLEGLRV